MFNEEDYKQLIADALFEKELINDEIYEKCSKPKVISALPGDGRTNDPNKLINRLNAIDKKNQELNDKLNNLRKEYQQYSDMDYDVARYWTKDRVQWKKDIDKFEKEDKPRLDAKLKIIDDAKKEWDALKKEFPDYETDWTDGWHINNIVEFADRNFRGSGEVPPISVLMDEILPYSKVINPEKDDVKYMLYFGNNYNTNAMDNKWKAKSDLNDLKRLNKKYGNLDGLISKFEKIIESPRKVQNEAKKYFIKKETYSSMESWYQSMGGEKAAKGLLEGSKKADAVIDDMYALDDERLEVIGKLENNGATDLVESYLNDSSYEFEL